MPQYTFKPIKASKVNELVELMAQEGLEGWHCAATMIKERGALPDIYIAIMEKEIENN